MTNYVRRIILCLCIQVLLLSLSEVHAQEVYQHVSSTGIYDYLDELSNAQIITLNSAVKPYSRILISEKLAEAYNKRAELNSRQQKELDFYLKDFSKELHPDKKFDKRLDLFYYKDTLFTFNINPILGMSYFSNDSGSFYHRWNGAEAYAMWERNWGSMPVCVITMRVRG